MHGCDRCGHIAPNDVEVLQVYLNLRYKFKVTNEGPIDEYLGIKVDRKLDNTLKLLQPLLMQQILEDLCFNQMGKKGKQHQH